MSSAPSPGTAGSASRNHLRAAKSWQERSRADSTGDDCWLGINVVVSPGVTIGRGCVVGANSVVTAETCHPIPCGRRGARPGPRQAPALRLRPRPSTPATTTMFPYFYSGFRPVGWRCFPRTPRCTGFAVASALIGLSCLRWPLVRGDRVQLVALTRAPPARCGTARNLVTIRHRAPRSGGRPSAPRPGNAGRTHVRMGVVRLPAHLR